MDTRTLPKIELHAHLNGSISTTTMEKLIHLKRCNFSSEAFADIEHLIRSDQRDLAACFRLFGCIYKLVDDLDAVELITWDILEEFEADGVVYLELRSTPKAYPGTTKRQYIETVLRVMNEYQKNHSMLCRFIVSIDRTKRVQEALENINLAAEFKGRGVVGIDLCGDPTKGNVAELLPLLQHAKEQGLKMTLHTAEVDNAEESQQLLGLLPDRIGHGTFLDYKLLDPAYRHIPVEICLTSNILCKTVTTIDDHHLQHIMEAKQPVCICTDDSGIFDTTLSKEWALAISSGHLRADNVSDILLRTTEYTFLESDEKKCLRDLVESRLAAAHMPTHPCKTPM
eukprot:m.133307 g.133307  ORF g.133307 m.133307 type:complete len:341 (+) comp15796_c0_seq7:1954-2976(+)